MNRSLTAACVCSLLCQIALLGGIAGAAGLPQVVPEKETPPVRPSGTTIAEIEASLRTELKREFPALDLESPEGRAFVWSVARWIHPDKTTGAPTVGTKYYNFAAENLARVQTLADALAATPLPAECRQAWREYYALRLIQLRFPIDVPNEIRRIQQLPAGTGVTVADPAAFRTALATAYPGFAARPGPEQFRWLTVLAQLNPDLRPGGYYRGAKEVAAKEPRVHAAVPLADGRIHVQAWDLRTPGRVLLPSQEWLSASAARVALPTAEPPAATVPAEVVELVLDGAGPDAGPLTLSFSLRDGEILHAWSATPAANNRVRTVAALATPLAGGSGETWVRIDADRAAGVCAIEIEEGKALVQTPIQFSASGTAALTGSYTLYGTGKSAGKVVRSGSLSGMRRTVSTAEPLRGDWTTWLGPVGTGLASPAGELLTDDVSRAPVLWVADEPIPDGRGPDARSKPIRLRPGQMPMGGWASPVVAEGKILQFYYEPSGSNYAYGAERPAAEDPFAYRASRVEADDVFHCLEAATGRTLWKRRFAGMGMNWAGFNKGGPQLGPAIHEGRVYAVGTLGNVYCVNLADGAVVWQTDIGLRHELMQHAIRGLIAEKALLTTRNDFQANAVVADGVIVVGDHRQTKMDYRYETDNGLIGLDAATGRTLWTLPEAAGTCRFQQGAQAWKHKDTWRLISSSKHGALLIEPKTGQVLATCPELTLQHTALGVGGDMVVGDVGAGGDPGADEGNEEEDPAGFHKVAAYRITGKTFTKAWQLPDSYGRLLGGCLYRDGRFYMQLHAPTKRIVCVDAESGRILAEAEADVAGGEHCPFIIGSDNRVIVCKDRTAGLIAFDADPARLTDSVREWNVRLATGYCGSLVPALVDGRLIVRLPNKLVCMDLRARSAREAAVTAAPARPPVAAPAQAPAPAAPPAAAGKPAPVKPTTPKPAPAKPAQPDMFDIDLGLE